MLIVPRFLSLKVILIVLHASLYSSAIYMDRKRLGFPGNNLSPKSQLLTFRLFRYWLGIANPKNLDLIQTSHYSIQFFLLGRAPVRQ